MPQNTLTNIVNDIIKNPSTFTPDNLFKDFDLNTEDTDGNTILNYWLDPYKYLTKKGFFEKINYNELSQIREKLGDFLLKNLSKFDLTKKNKKGKTYLELCGECENETYDPADQFLRYYKAIVDESIKSKHNLPIKEIVKKYKKDFFYNRVKLDDSITLPKNFTLCT